MDIDTRRACSGFGRLHYSVSLESLLFGRCRGLRSLPYEDTLCIGDEPMRCEGTDTLPMSLTPTLRILGCYRVIKAVFE